MFVNKGLVLLTGAVMVGLLLVACRSGSDSGPTDDDRALLERVMLTVDDVPTGLQAGSRTFSTNDEAAAEAEDYETEIAKYKAWKRLLGYDASFIPGPEADLDIAVGVQAEATLFENPEGALLWFGDQKARAEAKVNAGEFDSALVDPELTAVDARTVAPDAYWVRESGYETEQRDLLRVDNQILFSIGDIGVLVRVDVVARGISDRTFFATNSTQMAQVMADRIRAEVARALHTGDALVLDITR